MLKKLALFAGLFAVVLAAPASATHINWVDFGDAATEPPPPLPYPPGASSQTGLTAADGLTLDAAWSNTINFEAVSPSPIGYSVVIDDPFWGAESPDVRMLTTKGAGSTLAPLPVDTVLTFDFFAADGQPLPAGGSIAVIDLGNDTSTVTIEGLVAGSPVPVAWNVLFFEVAGEDINPPGISFPSATEIQLTGPGSDVVGPSNFTFLVTDVPLDAVTFHFEDPIGDDWVGFGAASQTVLRVPEPATMSLLALGALGLVRRRRRA